GYVRYDIGVGYNGLTDIRDKEDGDLNDTYFKRARFQLRVDSRAETELGTLRTYAAINFNYDTNGNYYSSSVPLVTDSSDYVGIEHAYIELGGFRVGKTDSLFSTFTGYASGVANDGIVPYGPFGTHQIAYTFNGGNGFSAAVALETGDGNGSLNSSDPNIYSIDSYVPHVVGGVGYTGGWGGVSLVAGYDSVWEEVAVKGRVDFNIGDALSAFVMAGWASKDEDIVRNMTTGPNYYGQWGGDWALWVGGAWKFNEKTTLNVEVGYDDADNFSTVVGLDYYLVNNFLIKPEVVYYDNFDDDMGYDGDNWGGFLRFQANFGG
ncbi:porin, partial [Mesorhizobium marinum]